MRTRPEPLSQAEKETFWASFGFQKRRIESEWRFKKREDLERVIRLEFGPQLAERILPAHRGLSIDYTFALYFRSS